VRSTNRGHGYKSSSEGLKRLIETCCDSSEKHLLPPESPVRDLFSTNPKAKKRKNFPYFDCQKE
jgi:hypothetical protein